MILDKTTFVTTVKKVTLFMMTLSIIGKLNSVNCDTDIRNEIFVNMNQPVNINKRKTPNLSKSCV
jgi:hypothetical protein